MDILALIAAFGGGIIGAYMGALPAFIMTGIYALSLIHISEPTRPY